jgi:hypothetical protein
MFGPGSTVIHQGSYAMVLLLLVSLAAWITTLPRWLPYLVLVCQGILFIVAWLLTSPANEFGVPNPWMITLGVVCGSVLVWMTLRDRGAEAAQSSSATKPAARPRLKPGAIGAPPS